MLVRHDDLTGVSGCGYVAQGVVFDDGTCAMRWLTETRSTAIYADLDDVRTIHGHGGATEIVFPYEDDGR